MPDDDLQILEPFDPGDPGTPEICWDRYLRTMPLWRPAQQPLLVVSPHPDDEVLAAGGLMRLHARAGFDVTVVSVTDGAAAFPDWVGLDQVRRHELDAGLRMLGGGLIQLERLGIPDGQVGAFRPTLHAAISRHADRRPIIVAPYECDGHPDHDAVGEVCGEVVRHHRLTLVRYPVWTWHRATPAAFAEARWARLPLDPATLEAKARAIECFGSQLKPVGRAPIVPPHVLSHFERAYEAFLL